MIKLNEKVPHFTAESTTGTFDLNQFRGKNLIIYFYPKDNTPGCTLESKAFRDHYEDFKKLNTEIVGISRDSMKSHCSFMEKQNLNFPLISDEDESISRLFDVLKEKSMFGKKYNGIVRSTFLIDANGVLKKEWRNISAIGHVNAVLNYIREA